MGDQLCDWTERRTGEGWVGCAVSEAQVRRDGKQSKSVEGDEMMDKLDEKAKTLIDALPTWKPLTVEVVWKSDVKKLVDTLLSVHQQEIDKLKKRIKELEDDRPDFVIPERNDAIGL